MSLTKTVLSNAVMPLALQSTKLEPATFVGILAVLLLSLVTIQSWSYRKRLQLSNAIGHRVNLWKAALLQTNAEVYQRLESDPAILLRDVDDFDGESRAEYQRARTIWSAWLAKRLKMEALLHQSGALYESSRTPPWWEISHEAANRTLNALSQVIVEIKPAQLQGSCFAKLADVAEPATIQSGDLPKSLTADGLSVEREFRRFSEAFTRSSQAIEALQQACRGGTDTNGGLSGACARLTALGLTLSPYQERIDSVLALSQELKQKIKREPLWNCTPSLQEMVNQIKALEDELIFACSMQQDFSSVSLQLEDVQSHIADLRDEAIVSGLPGVEMAGYWRLDEEGCDPVPFLAKAERELARWHSDLTSGQLDGLLELKASVSDALKNALLVVQKAQEDKLVIEGQMAEIAIDSTEADLKADWQRREEIKAGYAGQRWSQVLGLTSALLTLQNKRKAARAASASLLEELAKIRSELAENCDIFSDETEQIYRASFAEAEDLTNQAQLAQADYDNLNSRIVAFCKSRVIDVDSNVSLRGRMKRELAAHKRANEVVSSLRLTLGELKTKLEQNWGGDTAKQLFAAVQENVEQTLSLAARPKQDWSNLSFLAQQAIEQLAPARNQVDSALRRDKRCKLRLETLIDEIKVCRSTFYTREICGVVYGSGIYCALKEAEASESEVKELYHQRNYAQMEKLVEKARLGLRKNHLDAWWMCLQALSMSLDPCARQFACEHGYSEVGYEQWLNTHLAQSDQIECYNLPKITCNKHRPQEFEAMAVADQPMIEDYDRPS